MNPFPLTASGIKSRLAAMERERELLRELHALYAEHGDPAAPPRAAGTRTAAAGAVVQRPSRPASKGPHFINRSAVNGTTDAIHAVVKERPGILQRDLIEEVLRRVNTTAKKPRRNVANIARAQVKAGKLASRQGGFYPVPA